MKNASIKVTVPAPREPWLDILRQDPQAMISQQPAWTDCICRSLACVDASRLYELTGGRRMVLPMVRSKWLPAAVAVEMSQPHGWGTGGPAATGGVRPEDLEVLLADLSSRITLRMAIRPNPLSESLWANAAPPSLPRSQHITSILDLEGGFERVWNERFSSDTRNKIRKAEKAGLVVETDTTGRLLPVFYDLFLTWTERRARERQLPLLLARWLALRREPMRKFQAVSQTFGDSCRLWVAWLGGQPVAAAYSLVFGQHAIYWRSASDKALTQQTRANDLLQRLMIEDACLSGCRYYHMGESGGVASLMHFKSRFAAVEVFHHEYYLERLPITRFEHSMQRITRKILR